MDQPELDADPIIIDREETIEVDDRTKNWEQGTVEIDQLQS